MCKVSTFSGPLRGSEAAPGWICFFLGGGGGVEVLRAVNDETQIPDVEDSVAFFFFFFPARGICIAWSSLWVRLKCLMAYLCWWGKSGVYGTEKLWCIASYRVKARYYPAVQLESTEIRGNFKP